MFKISDLYPDKYYDSSYVIPYEELYSQGYRGLIYDIDNTLVPHDAPADERAIELFKRLKDIGFTCMLLSNNKQPRVDMFNKDIGILTTCKAGKPKVAGYQKAMKAMGTDVTNTIFIGDQIFTDIWGAKRSGIKAFMVKYIDPHEEIQIVIKRWFERPVLWMYKKSIKNKK